MFLLLVMTRLVIKWLVCIVTRLVIKRLWRAQADLKPQEMVSEMGLHASVRMYRRV